MYKKQAAWVLAFSLTAALTLSSATNNVITAQSTEKAITESDKEQENQQPDGEGAGETVTDPQPETPADTTPVSETPQSEETQAPSEETQAPVSENQDPAGTGSEQTETTAEPSGETGSGSGESESGSGESESGSGESESDSGESETGSEESETDTEESESGTEETEAVSDIETETDTETETETETERETETEKKTEKQTEEEVVVEETETEKKETEKQTEKQTEKPAPQEQVVVQVAGETPIGDAGLGELYLAVSGYPVESLSKNEAEVYKYLRKELKLNKAAAAGVLANIYCESNFSTIAIGDGGTSLGLCQWHNERCRSLIGWCQMQEYDYRSVEGQVHYLGAELRGGYKNVLEFLEKVPDNAEGAYQAAYYFCMHFEIPDNTAVRSDARGQIAAKTYYPADLDRYLVEDEEESEGISEAVSEEEEVLDKEDASVSEEKETEEDEAVESVTEDELFEAEETEEEFSAD